MFSLVVNLNVFFTRPQMLKNSDVSSLRFLCFASQILYVSSSYTLNEENYQLLDVSS